MTDENDNRTLERRGLTIVADTHNEDVSLALAHRHSWELVATHPGLQEAQMTLGWDVSVSRILGVNNAASAASYTAVPYANAERRSAVRIRSANR